jgi:CheY-like chemotaxis protein
MPILVVEDHDATALILQSLLKRLGFSNVDEASAHALFVNSAAASTASHPASVTIAIRPSRGCDGTE